MQIYFSLQGKDEVADVGSLLTFDLSFSLPDSGCTGLCPVLNSYLHDSFRRTVSPEYNDLLTLIMQD